jgi:hypothetical protein
MAKGSSSPNRTGRAVRQVGRVLPNLRRPGGCDGGADVEFSADLEVSEMNAIHVGDRRFLNDANTQGENPSLSILAAWSMPQGLTSLFETTRLTFGLLRPSFQFLKTGACHPSLPAVRAEASAARRC